MGDSRVQIRPRPCRTLSVFSAASSSGRHPRKLRSWEPVETDLTAASPGGMARLLMPDLAYSFDEHRSKGDPVGVEAPSISEEMRRESAAIWDGLHGHPFLGELAAGTLPLEKFRFFLEQDNFYLIEYARCLAMGAAKSRNETELRYFTVDLNQVLDAELPSNRALLAKVTEMGAADRGGSLTMAPANVAYTSFMQSLALRGGPLEIMAALLPCAWSYVEIAAGLADQGTTDNQVYADWVGYFTLESNVQMVASMRRDLDGLVIEEGVGPARREELSRIFATSSRLERGFWEMAYILEQWPDVASD